VHVFFLLVVLLDAPDLGQSWATLIGLEEPKLVDRAAGPGRASCSPSPETPASAWCHRGGHRLHTARFQEIRRLRREPLT
jgi:hypothetical protein